MNAWKIFGIPLVLVGIACSITFLWSDYVSLKEKTASRRKHITKKKTALIGLFGVLCYALALVSIGASHRTMNPLEIICGIILGISLSATMHVIIMGCITIWNLNGEVATPRMLKLAGIAIILITISGIAMFGYFIASGYNP